MPVYAEELRPTTFSYARIYDLITQFEDIDADDRDRLEFWARLRSNTENVRYEDISLEIVRNDKATPVKLNELGMIVLPMSTRLRSQNPTVVSNQPIGSLRLGLAIVIKPPGRGSFNYSELVEAVDQVNNAVRKKARVPANQVPEAVGITFKFDPADESELVINLDGSTRREYADETGTLNLRIENELIDEESGEGPSVSLSSRPLVIFPWFGR